MEKGKKRKNILFKCFLNYSQHVREKKASRDRGRRRKVDMHSGDGSSLRRRFIHAVRWSAYLSLFLRIFI